MERAQFHEHDIQKNRHALVAVALGSRVVVVS